jgi:hypothetical protein
MTSNRVMFVAEYEDGSSAEFSIDRGTLSLGDYVARIIARERQENGELPPGAIMALRRVEWLPPRLLRERYVDRAVHDISEGKRQMYLAVTSGRIRARSKGIVFGPEYLKNLAELKFDDDDPFALPGDIELSVDDAKREWGIE